MSGYRRNDPRAHKMLQALRSVGYNNYGALADLADNSIDAGARHVYFDIREILDGEFEIVVADDGCGMDDATLDEALRLGTDIERDPSVHLGLYGMGLDTATMSIAGRTEVITKTKDGPLLKAVHDLEVIRRENEFVKEQGPADEEDQLIFRRYLREAKSGTVIVMSDCDRLTNRQPRSFANVLSKHLGQTFRWYLSNGREFVVNKEPVPVIDPLMEATEGTEIFFDETLPFHYHDPGEERRLADVRIRLAILPQYSREVNEQVEPKILPRHQGFYVLRNFREIMAGETFDYWIRHNTMNRFRGEIYIPGPMSGELISHFTKQGAVLSQSLRDQLDKVLRPQVSTVRKRLDREEVKVAQQTVSFDDISRLITQKSPLLLKPMAKIERREPKGEEKGTVEQKGTGTSRRRFKKTQLKAEDLNCRFETISMTPAGPIYDRDMEGRTLVVKWNVDHPFYRRFVLDNADDKDIVDGVAALVYCLANAELTYVVGQELEEELSVHESEALLDGFRNQVSTNMRILLTK